MILKSIRIIMDDQNILECVQKSERGGDVLCPCFDCGRAYDFMAEGGVHINQCQQCADANRADADDSCSSSDDESCSSSDDESLEVLEAKLRESEEELRKEREQSKQLDYELQTMRMRMKRRGRSQAC